MELDKIAITATDVSSEMEENELHKIGERCRIEFDLDKSTLVEWERMNEEGLKLARQIMEAKMSPWPGCSNVKYPLISWAAVQFNARSYSELIRGTQPVKCKVIGQDTDGHKKDRAERVSKHMSYQILEQMPDWEEEMDSLLMALPIVGTAFKQTYWDVFNHRPCSEFFMPDQVIVNNKVKSLERARRVSKIFWMYKNDVEERKRAELWSDVVPLALDNSNTDPQGPFEFIEQHRWLDLDDDDYEEPYIVTYERASGAVVRIMPRFRHEDIQHQSKSKVLCIKPRQFFSRYIFLPSMNEFYGTGWGQLLGPINESMNTMMNQLIDSGTLSNSQTGFISKSLRIRGGEIKLKMGEFKQVDSGTQDLRGAILPTPFKEPSMVLFQLLQFVAASADKLASVSEVLTGEQSGTNVPATTTLALIEQGTKVMGSVNKRVYRGLTDEFKIIGRLNAEYLDEQEYFRILDDQQAISKYDYDQSDLDIIPTADPNSSSDTQRLIRAEALVKTIGMPGAGDPHVIMREYYAALKVENLDEILPKNPPPPPPPPPNPQLMKVELEGAAQDAKIAMELEVLKSTAALNFAKAQALEQGQQLDELKHEVDTLFTLKASNAPQQGAPSNGQQQQQPTPPGGANGMEGQPPDPASLPNPQEGAAILGMQGAGPEPPSQGGGDIPTGGPA